MYPLSYRTWLPRAKPTSMCTPLALPRSAAAIVAHCSTTFTAMGSAPLLMGNEID